MSTPTLFIGNKNYSSWSLRAWLYLHASGVAFEERRLSLDTPAFTAAIAGISPTGRVPVLVDGDARVWEALAICEYADQRYGLAGWPAAPAARAEALAIAHEMHAGFAALRDEFPMNCRARRRGPVPSPAAAADIGRIGEIWSGCRQRHGHDGDWLFGAFGIADAMYAPVALRCRTYDLALPAAASAYVSAVVNHPSVAAWVDAAALEPETIPHEERGDPR